MKAKEIRRTALVLEVLVAAVDATDSAVDFQRLMLRIASNFLIF